MKNACRMLALCAGLLVSSGGSAQAQSAAADLFAPGDVLEVAIDVDEANWDTLRSEGRSLPHLFGGCFAPDFEYTHVPASVTVNGQQFEGVDMRKKGFLGSLSTHRPSLRLDFGDGDHDGRTVQAERRLTLNNNHQDPTNAKQCVAYELFAEAGLPAPRCGLAHVTVNGEDKGFYTNVEPIKKPFLRRAFDDDDGNLYELTVADFTPEGKAGFELKTNEREGDRSDLDRVEAALAAPDDRLIEALGEVFDFEELLTFWAMEVVTGHWDGMTGNRNNTFLYHDPTDDRFHPIPWGIDGSFQQHLFIPDAPASVYAFNTISRRLYAVPEARRQYHARLRELLDEVWDEARVLARFRAIAERTGGNAAALTAAETWVRGRRAAIEAELASNDGNGPEITTDRPFDPGGCREPERASGIIDFTWNDVPIAFQPVADLEALQLEIPLPGGDVQFVQGQVAQLATINPQGQAQLALAGLDPSRGAAVVFVLLMPEQALRVGEIPFHGVETFGAILNAITMQPLALIGGGSITLTELTRENGAPVRGRWEGLVAPLPASEAR